MFDCEALVTSLKKVDLRAACRRHWLQGASCGWASLSLFATEVLGERSELSPETWNASHGPTAARWTGMQYEPCA